MTKINIFRLQTADVDPVFEILKGIYQSPEYPMGGAWTRANLEREIDHGISVGLRLDNALVAFVILRSAGAEALEIVVLASHRDYRRRGLMKTLIQHIVRDKGPEQEIWLEVHEANRAAQKLYKTLGFRQVGKRAKYYSDGSTAILMSLR